MNAIETYTKSNGDKLEIVHDSCAESPREWDNLSTILAGGNYSHLGDKHEFDLPNTNLQADLEYLMSHKDVAHVQLIFGYSHSGLTISLTPYSCRWDSGVFGFLVITKAAIRKEYGIKRVSKQALAKAIEVAEAEVKVLDQYVSGEVYGFQIEDKNGEHIDSCYGFYGSDIKTNGIIEHIDEEWEEIIG